MRLYQEVGPLSDREQLMHSRRLRTIRAAITAASSKALIGIIPGLLLFGLAQPAAGAPNTTVEIRQGAVFLGGNRVTRATSLADYEKILGHPDRVNRLKYTLHTYDKLGIRLYQQPAEQAVRSFSLDFVKANFDFSPSNAFGGAFIVDGRQLRTDFARSNLLSLSGFRLHSAFKTLDWPAVILVQGNLMLTFDYGELPNQLQGVGISWQEPQTNTIRKVPPSSNRPSSVHLSPRSPRESARKAEPGASPNGGRAEPLDNSCAGDGPPSVS
jgi:hypothetical protein